jgi:VWFA-related protein
MKHKLVALKSIILFAFAAPALAQFITPGMGAPMEVPSRQQTPIDRKPLTFSSKAQYVLVPVIVTDKSQAAIKGLKKEDFTILENGKPQPVSSVEEINTAAAAAQLKKAPAATDEFSNSLDSGGQARRITIIALDLINTPVLDQSYARKSIIKMLASAPDDGSLIELVTIDSRGMKIIHSFSDDPKVLLRVMRALDGKFGGTEAYKPADMAAFAREALRSTGGRDKDGVPINSYSSGTASPIGTTYGKYSNAGLESFAGASDGFYNTIQRQAAVGATLAAFQRIAASVESVPGRKSLVWVSDGFPFYIDGTSAEMLGSGSYASYERTMMVLANANVAIYPVDARGLVGLSAPDDQSRYAVGDVGGTESQVSNMTSNHNNTIDTFRNVAKMTGGREFYNRNDIGTLVSDAMHDSSDYYMLSFPLNKANTQAGWRKLEVKVKGSGYKIRARQGYFVTRATLEQFEAKQPDLENALASPLEFTSLPIRAKWLGDPLQGKAGKVVQFELDLPANAIAPEENENKVSLDFRVSAVTMQGEPKGDVKQTFEGTLPPAGAEQLKKEGVKYKSSFELLPGEYTVHFVVRDNITGKVGSVIAQLKVTG